MASEQFSLCWDNFHKNMSSGMNSLLENEDLVDVTLAVEGKCLKAHKMVLSVCSPYFKELFKSNPCQHPIVFMKDVSYVALSDLLQFMYQGEVQVSQENLTTFIKTAEALQIKGLTGDGNGSADSESTETTPHEKPVHQIEEYKPVPRPKKQVAAPITTPSPTAKRQRLSVSSSDSQPLPSVVAKSEPVAAAPPAPETVQFKMEPYDQSQSLVDETGDENFGDDTMDDAAVDDTEDYSMMEGGTVGDEEPQAGTSTDGAGEGQAFGKLFMVLKDIQFKLKLIDQRLSKIEDTLQISGHVPGAQINLLPKLPFTTLEDIVNFDDSLKNKETETQMENYLRTTGGATVKIFIKRNLEKLFTNFVGQFCSWTGKKQNFRLKDLKLMEVLFGTTKKNYHTLTDVEFEREVMTWFQYAKLRYEREGH